MPCCGGCRCSRPVSPSPPPRLSVLGADIEPDHVLGLLTSIVDKCLVQADPAPTGSGSTIP